MFTLFTIDGDGSSAGGAFDCGPACSFYQDVIAAAFFGLPMTVVVLVIATGAIVAIHRAHRFR